MQLMLSGVSRESAFLLNVTIIGLWHGVGGGWVLMFLGGGMLSKASTTLYKAGDLGVLGYCMALLSLVAQFSLIGLVKVSDTLL